MRAPAQRAKNFFLLSVVAVFWLSGDQPARAGGGGADFTGLQNYINSVCTTVAGALGITISNCPQVPTISQGVLELSALHDNTLEAARSQLAIPVAPYVDAANPSRPPANPETCETTSCVDPLNPITGLPIDPSVLSTLRPLAFISAEKDNGTATPTQLSDTDANIFFYVVGGKSSASMVDPLEPDTLLLFYEVLPQDEDDRRMFVPRLASFSLPLTVLNSDSMTERAVPAVLRYKAPAPGGKTPPAPCSASAITASFSGSGTQTLSPAALGIDCAVTFGATPLSSHPHAVFEISIPLLVTFNTDPIIVDNYYGFARDRSSNAFPDNVGFQPASCPGNNCILGANGSKIGIAPSAGPLGPAVTSSSPPATYSLCANLPTKGRFAPPVPAVAAFYAIAGNGADVLVSAPLAPTPPGIVCPAM
jgi:hypothetical protein